MLECVPVIVGPFAVNCYVVWNPASRAALVIDPGDDADLVLDAVRSRNLAVRGVLLTHAHVDHIRGVGAVAAACRVPVWVHPADQPMYRSPRNSLPPWLAAAEHLPEPAAWPPAPFPDLSFQMLETPGHTPGGVCWHFPGDALLFSGDTLFQRSVGRTDLPGGDAAALLASIRTRLLTLPPETRVFPGHGDPTTIAAESANNPYL